MAPARSRMPALFAAAASAPVRPSAARAAHRELALAPTFVSGQSFLWDLRANALAHGLILCRMNKAVAHACHRPHWPETNVGASASSRCAARAALDLTGAENVPAFVSGQSFLWDLRANALAHGLILCRMNKAVAHACHRPHWPETNVGASASSRCAARAALGLTGAENVVSVTCQPTPNLKADTHKKGEPKLSLSLNNPQPQPIVIKLALPPAAAVFTLTARSITSRSSAI